MTGRGIDVTLEAFAGLPTGAEVVLGGVGEVVGESVILLTIAFNSDTSSKASTGSVNLTVGAEVTCGTPFIDVSSSCSSTASLAASSSSS